MSSTPTPRYRNAGFSLVGGVSYAAIAMQHGSGGRISAICLVGGFDTYGIAGGSRIRPACLFFDGDGRGVKLFVTDFESRPETHGFPGVCTATCSPEAPNSPTGHGVRQSPYGLWERFGTRASREVHRFQN